MLFIPSDMKYGIKYTDINREIQYYGKRKISKLHLYIHIFDVNLLDINLNTKYTHIKCCFIMALDYVVAIN